ncbi:Oligo-1,6-glucosidase [compost metagenome]
MEQALADEDSIFHYYRRLIELRKQHEVIVYGRYELLNADDNQVYAYTRTLGQEQLLVVLNFYDQPARFNWTTPEAETLSPEKAQAAELLIANYDGVPAGADVRSMDLRPYEARVYKLS